MLSTIVAIFDGHEGENRTFDETDWSDLGKTRLIYHKSKTLAERAAWDFIHSDENQSKMEMVAINPSNVFGPVLDGHLHTSTEWYRTIMRAEVPGVARTQLDFVDVRDLVNIFVKALSVPDATGKRFILNAASIPLIEFAEILHQHFSDRGYRIPNRILPDMLVRLLAIFIPKARAVAGQLKWTYSFSTEQARLIFGWQPQPYQQTIINMAESLIEFDLI
jgi:dihydroflavonol-4-reductase